MARLEPLDAPRSLAEDAADRIREQILSGGFRQGDHLVESRIAADLNISRGPVREAFKLLRAEGLLQEEPRRGSFVVRLSPDDVRGIYGLRAAIEGRAASMVADARDPGVLAHLSALVDEIEAAVSAGEATAVFSADLAFHAALVSAAGNPSLQEVFDRYVPTLRALLRLDEHVYRRLDDIAKQHRPLLDALASGESNAAREHAEEHCDHAGELIAAYMETRETP
jgi:DNA-binding GntR family transcriptional regulator